MALLYLFSNLTQRDDCCIFCMVRNQILLLVTTVLTGFPWVAETSLQVRGHCLKVCHDRYFLCFSELIIH